MNRHDPLIPRRWWWLLGMALATMAGAAERAHPFTPLSVEAALHDARVLAERHPGAQVVRIEGRSMLPFFGDGSVAVVRPIGVDRVRAGMILVYRNRFGERVAHRAIEATADGWVVRGHANAQSDTTRVDADNLLGVVYATFYSSGRVHDPVALPDLVKGTLTALAAPAR